MRIKFLHVLRLSHYLFLAPLFGPFFSTEAWTSPNPIPSLNWKTTIEGYVTDVVFSQTKGVWAATTIADGESGLGDTRLFFYNSRGRRLWKFQLSSAARTLEISKDGSGIGLNLRDDRLLMLDSHGKIVWEKKGTCRLIPIKNGSICFYDDDALTQMGDQSLIIYDLKGKELRRISYGSLSQDSLGIKLSPNEERVLMWFPDGQVRLENIADSKSEHIQEVQDGKNLKKIEKTFHFQGIDITDLCFVPAHSPEDFNLVGYRKKDKRRVLIQIRHGKGSTFEIPDGVTQVAVSNSKSPSTVLIGNGKEGQNIYFYGEHFKTPLKHWHRAKAGNYFDRIRPSQGRGQSHGWILGFGLDLVRFNEQGQETWKLPETRDEGQLVYGILQDQLVFLGEENQVRAYRLPR